MERRRLGRTGMDVSALGFGGSEIGYESASQTTVTRLLNAALDAGLNVIDTAECYIDSEALIGAAVRGRRRELFLFTKCGHPRGFGAGDWRPASLLTSIERSLERLRTDAVDLVQLHSCSEAELRRGDAVAALETARARGMTRYIGYSGDGAAARYAVESGHFDTLRIADQEARDGAASASSPSGRSRTPPGAPARLRLPARAAVRLDRHGVALHAVRRRRPHCHRRHHEPGALGAERRAAGPWTVAEARAECYPPPLARGRHRRVDGADVIAAQGDSGRRDGGSAASNARARGRSDRVQ
jgi:hypothetical protein